MTPSKPKYGMMPWQGLVELMQPILYGARKHGDTAYEDVDPQEYRESMLRHVLADMQGEEFDKETGMPHLAHAGACIAIYLHVMSKQEVDQ